MKEAPNNLPAAGALGEQLSFIDPPVFCPTWPTRNTLAERALRRFLDGDVLDHTDFITGCGSWRLAAVVFQLRALGWPIETRDAARHNAENRAITIARYHLPARVAAEALALHSRREA